MKKTFLFSMLILISISLSALEPFTLKLTKTDQTCLGNGTVTALAEEVTAGANVSFGIYSVQNPISPLQVGQGTSIATGYSFKFTSLPEGEYIVKVTQQLGEEENEQQEHISIVNKMVPIDDFTYEQKQTDCNNPTLIVNVSEGYPKYYSIIKKEGGEVVVPKQTSNELNILGLEPTQNHKIKYLLRVEDRCGDEYTKDLELKTVELSPAICAYQVTNYDGGEPELTIYNDENWKYRDDYVYKNATCDVVDIPVMVGNRELKKNQWGGDDFDLKPFEDFQYPISVNATLKSYKKIGEDPYDDDSYQLVGTYTDTHQLTSAPDSNKLNLHFDATLPRISRFELEMEIKDACGKIKTYKVEEKNQLKMYNLSVSSYLNSDEDCNPSTNFSVTYSNSIIPGGIYKFKLLEYPSDFNPSENGFDNNLEITFPIHMPDGSTQYGFHIDSVPLGSYKGKFIFCNGFEVEKSDATKEIADDFEVRVGTNDDLYYNCALDRASSLPFYQHKEYDNYQKLYYEVEDSSVVILEAPEAFVNQYGPVPYNNPKWRLGTNFEVNPNQGFYGLPFGHYKIKFFQRCTGKESIVEYDVPNPPKIVEEVELIKNCTSFNVVVHRKNEQGVNVGTGSNATYGLQLYYPQEDVWGGIDGESPYFGDYVSEDNLLYDSSISQRLRGYGESFNYLERAGKYRVIYLKQKRNSWSVEGGDKNCPVRVVKELGIAPYAIRIANFFVFGCEDGTVSLFVMGEGQKPLKYQIVGVNGSPTSSYSEQDVGFFSNLTPAVYTIKVTDGCYNSRNVDVSAKFIRLPKILPRNICQGSNGSLLVEGLSQLKLEWYKDGVATGVIGNKYPFTPFTDADKGVYTVSIKNPDPASTCPNEVLTIDLTDVGSSGSAVHAGTGKTVTYKRQNKVINLFDNIEGEYDNYGTWIDMDYTGALLGNYLNLKDLRKGTYRFKYKVQGFCDDVDETIVTINILHKNYWYGTESNVWDVPNNWTGNVVPAKYEDVIFATEANNGDNPNPDKKGTAIRDLHVPVGLTNKKDIGKLINESTVNLIVPADASLTIHGTVTGSSTPDDVDKIQVKAEKDKPNGTIIFKGQPCDTELYGTVQMYAKGYKGSEEIWTDNIVGSPTLGQQFKSSYHWQHFGVPVEEIKADDTFSGSYLREYDETYNAPNMYYHKWHDLNNGSVLKAFKGYEITQESPTTYELSGKFQFCDKTVTMTRRAAAVSGSTDPNVGNRHYGLGQNVFGNSYTSSINIQKIEFPIEVEHTVYLYNTGRFQDWATVGEIIYDENVVVAGQYLSIPVYATYIFDGRIPSMNGFLLRFDDSETYFNGPDVNVKLHYGYGGVVPNTHPQTVKKEPLSYLKVILSSKSTIDRLWLCSQKGTSEEFDNGWDGRKFFGTPTAFIYSETGAGNMQVNTSSTLHNKVITFYSNKDKEYRLYIKKENLGNYPHLKLIDLVEKTVTPLNKPETVYEFEAEKENVTQRRFKIVNLETITEDVFNDLSDGIFGAFYGKKIEVSNYTKSKGVVKVYDVSGRLVMSETMNIGSSSYSVDNLEQGTYVVSLTAGGKDKQLKIVVR